MHTTTRHWQQPRHDTDATQNTARARGARLSAQPLLLLSRLRARDQDSRRTDLLSPDDPYAWVCGPPHMRKMAILKSVVHALDYKRYYHVEF